MGSPGTPTETTMEITITLPDAVEFESRGIAFSFPLAEFAEAHGAEHVVAAIVAGITKSGIDSGSTAKTKADKDGTDTETATRELIESWIAARVKNGWPTGGAGIDAELIAMFRPAVKKKDEKAYKDADESERRRMIAEYFAGLSDAQRETAERVAKERAAVKAEEAKRRAAEREANAEFLASLGIATGA